MLNVLTSLKVGNVPKKFLPDLPVITIIGDDDLIKHQLALDASPGTVPQGKVVVIPGVGHWLMVEAKDEILKVLTSWLGEVVLEK